MIGNAAFEDVRGRGNGTIRVVGIIVTWRIAVNRWYIEAGGRPTGTSNCISIVDDVDLAFGVSKAQSTSRQNGNKV